MKKRALALSVAFCLTLTACGGGTEAAQTGEQTAEPSPLEQAAGVGAEEILLTIDGREVPAWRYLCWLAYICGQLTEQYQASGLTPDWDTPVDSGTLADYAKDQALADTALYATVENLAERYDCTAEGDLSALPALENCGLTAAQLQELAAVGQLYAALYQLSQDGGSDLTPDAETLAAYGEQVGAVTLDRLLVPLGEDPEAAQQQVAELFAQLNGAQDQSSLFSQLAAANGDAAGPRTVLPDDGTLDETLLEAAQTLQEGQISGILESSEGFSILRRLPLDTEALAAGYFDAWLQATAEQAQVTVSAAYTDLKPGVFYENLQATRQTGAEQ
jgi:hypothetical protein